jgi:hypothetical protein
MTGGESQLLREWTETMATGCIWLGTVEAASSGISSQHKLPLQRTRREVSLITPEETAVVRNAKRRCLSIPDSTSHPTTEGWTLQNSIYHPTVTSP